MHSLTLFTILASVASVLGHGYVSDATIGGTTYSGMLPCVSLSALSSIAH